MTPSALRASVHGLWASKATAQSESPVRLTPSTCLGVMVPWVSGRYGEEIESVSIWVTSVSA